MEVLIREVSFIWRSGLERLHGISKEDALYTVNGMAGPNISLSDL